MAKIFLGGVFWQNNDRRFVACRCMALCAFFFAGVMVCAAQEVIIAGSERTESTRKNPSPPATKPAVARPRQTAYIDVDLVADDDCILTIDGARQKDTLRAGKATVKKLTSGTHRVSAESITTGYVHTLQVKVDAGVKKPTGLPVKAEFEAHIKRVETALAQQQR